MRTAPHATAGIDFGLSNIDIALDTGAEVRHYVTAARRGDMQDELRRAVAVTGLRVADLGAIAVTGGRHRDIPDAVDGVVVVHADEIASVGLGGLALAGLAEALVVSAGTGTAIVAARGGVVRHVTGTAVGGGTMQGLARLMLGTTDPGEIDALAAAGDPNGVDLSIAEAIGGKIASLPPDATAVNFGRVARDASLAPSRRDLAAALVRMVGQVISLLATNAARAERLDTVVMVGHLMDMPTMRRACLEVAALYGARFEIPADPGTATVTGALAQLR